MAGRPGLDEFWDGLRETEKVWLRETFRPYSVDAVLPTVMTGRSCFKRA